MSKFIVSELGQQDYLQNFEILYPIISLIKITNGKMSEKAKLIMPYPF